MITRSAVAQAAGRHLGVDVTAVEPVDGFAHHDDFLLAAGPDAFVVKAADPPVVAAEAWACERARAAGVAAPEVVAVDASRTLLPRAFLIERRLPGAPVDPTEHDVIAQAGRQLRLLHAVGGTGYGFLAEATELPQGPCAAWADVLAKPLRRLDAMARDGFLPSGWPDRLRALVATETPRRPAGPGVLLHGDLDPRHLFARSGQLTGIIDWGDCLIGDPMFDLARFTRTEPAALTALLSGYGLDHTPELGRTITFYRAVWTLVDLDVDFDDGDTSWVPAHRTVLADALRDLDA